MGLTDRAPEPIINPSDLHLPPEVGKVLANLSPYGREVFIQEVTEALVQSQKKNNLRPLQEVVEAWYRTLLAREHPEYEANMTRARRSRPRKGVSLEEINERLGV